MCSAPEQPITTPSMEAPWPRRGPTLAWAMEPSGAARSRRITDAATGLARAQRSVGLFAGPHLEKEVRGEGPAYLRDCWLLAVRCGATVSREPCGCRSPDMSSRLPCMSWHILSNDEAEIMWHLRSTCHVMGV